MSKLPAIQFYPGDWRKDIGVQSLNYHERGIWFEMLLLMHESEIRGKLMLGGKAMTDEVLASVLRIDLANLTETISTLIARGVTERDRTGALVNRRMLRDEDLRADNREKLNGWRKAKKLKQNGNQSVPIDVTEMKPLSSSSSSTTKQVQKPSRGKRGPRAKDPTKTDLANARHADFKAIIGEYWVSKNPGVQMPWDGREGKHLEMFLRAAPDITTDQFRMFLRNRYKSEVNHGERASQWIAWVASYAAGPVDRFGKTIQTGGENGTHQPSAAKQRLHDNRLALAKAAVKRGWIAPDDFAGEGAEALAEPGHSGIDGGISGGLRAVGPEILPPEDRDGAKGPAN